MKQKKVQVRSKGIDLDAGLGLGKDEIKRAVAVDYVIDTDKRGKDGYHGGEPKMTE
ncbi:hypothetical protein [Oceanihabitans sediminis]|uniref:hypothetical protein n=1 Tax=Oceanihabitans sediminis TaxID=1812012 RepID=UPI00299EE812|nr:hypothetical protein [Oceanihabitans sediminis]MDX1278559.1 hypothetical protein [Oceanihabitans sediminis]